MCLKTRFSALLFLLLTAALFPVSGQTSGDRVNNSVQEIITLVQGQPSERALAGGQLHRYRLSLQEAQFLHITVTQKQIDVIVSLFSPSGQNLLEIDSPIGDTGQESFSYISETAGDYILEIRSPDAKVPAGSYEAAIAELRTATEKDKFRTAAEKYYAEAETLLAQNTPDSERKSIEQYLASIEQWRLFGDKKEEATALNKLGLVLGDVDENGRAFAAYTQAARLFEEIGDRKYLSRTQHNIGLLYKLSDPRKALEYFKPALETFRAVGDRFAEPVALNNIAECYYYMSEYQAALDAYEPALALWTEQSNSRDMALALSGMGVIYGILGNTEREKNYYEQSLALRQSVGDKRGESNALNNLGFVYYKQGDMTKSLKFYEQALTIRRAIRSQREEAVTLRNMGNVYRAQGQMQKALETYQSVLTIFQASNDLYWFGRTLASIGITYSGLGDRTRARETLQQALAINQKTVNRGDESQMLYQLALLDQAEGDFAGAENKIKIAITYAESLRSTLFNTERRSGYFASAQNFFELYTDLLMQQHKLQPNARFDVTAFQTNERALARSLMEILAESQTNIRQGVSPDLLEKERDLQGKFNLRTSALTRLLTTKSTEAQVTTMRNEIDGLKREYDRMQAEIRANSPRYAALTQPQPLTLSEIRQQVLDDDTLLFEYALGEKRSYLWLVGRNSFQTFELPERAKIETAARRFYELLTARNKRIKFETNDEKNTRVANADGELPAAAADLSQMILAPAARQLGNKRLLIVASGALQYIPFDSLQNGKRFLIETNEIVNLPSASVLAVLRRELKDRPPAPKTLAVLADPVFDRQDERLKNLLTRNAAQPKIENIAQTSGKEKPKMSALKRAVSDTDFDAENFTLPRLVFTRQEANTIIKLTPPDQRKELLDFAANRSAALDAEFSQYRIIHFATHSFINSRHPELSGIVLSLIDENGKEQDGFLRTDDIYNLKLPAELAVLSGCRTGLGKEIRGEGLIGMTRGFMYAGAKRVAVTLWDVNDEATAELMTGFYRGMLKEKLSPAAALRQAQISMLKDKRWNNPYYWATFTIQGEPR